MYILRYYISSIKLVRCIHHENTYMYIGHVYTHEHDFDLAKSIESNKQLLTCCMCNILYCEKCGKEVSIPYSCLDAEGNGAQMSMRSG
jgi:hypothetical protein